MASLVHRLDHYEVLGVPENAPKSSIVEAWQRCREAYDPERVSELHLEDQADGLRVLLDRAELAYKVLASVKLRTRYDRVRTDVLAQAERQSRSRAMTQIKVRRELVEKNLERASQLMKIGEQHLAVVLLETAADLEPSASVYVALARVLSARTTTTGRALVALRDALTVDPEHLDAWLELAAIWRRRRCFDKERRALERAVAAHPDSREARALHRRSLGAARGPAAP
jgi:tetratricopeptide (TPR) repeat protein